MTLVLADLWDFSNPAASESRFATALNHDDARASKCVQAEVLTQLARAQGLQRQFDDARATLDRAEALVVLGDSRAGIRLLLERGRVTNTLGNSAGSTRFFEQAWNMARRLSEDALAVDAAHMLGIVMSDEAGFGWNTRAMELAESSADPTARKWSPSLRNNMGWWLHDHARLEEALAMFQTAAAERERSGVRGPLLIARWAVARCLRSMGRVEEALASQRELAAEHARDGTADGFVQEELGECLLALGRDPEAAPHFRRAHELLAADPHLCTNQPDRLERLAKLARV